jgi:hypothetical protein
MTRRPGHGPRRGPTIDRGEILLFPDRHVPHPLVRFRCSRRAFTLIELLVVIDFELLSR